MSENVLADPQFNVASILRPFEGFEAVYNGQSVDTPLMFTVNGTALDPLAGTVGYSPKLLKGLSVPYGARIVLWLPIVAGIQVSEAFATSLWYYKWTVSWRLRNVYDFRQSRIPFHYPKQGAGVADTNYPPQTRARVVIPAAVNSIAFTQVAPVAPSSITTTTVLNADITSPNSAAVSLPFLPDGTLGYYQQGLLNPGAVAGEVVASQPLYIPYEIQCEGDELLLGMTRPSSPDVGSAAASGTWAFSGVDGQISLLFGNGSGTAYPDIGVYVSAGSAP